MIRLAAFDGVAAVEPFEQDDEGEFVLQREVAELPNVIARLTKVLGMPVSAADEEADRFPRFRVPTNRFVRPICEWKSAYHVHRARYARCLRSL